MRKKHIWIVMLAMLTVFGMLAITACDNGKTEPEQPSEPEEAVYNVILYYANAEYLQTGNGELDPLLVWEDEISATAQDVYKDTVELLYYIPGEEYASMLTEDITVLDVYAKSEEQTIFVDFASKGLSGGSQEEELLIDQVVETLLQSFAQEGYSKVQFLVDDEMADTLMGHMDVSQPFGPRSGTEEGGIE